jgi:hypothetical protein
MKNRLIAAFVCFGLAGSAGAAEIDFDKGVDVKEAVEKAATMVPPPPPGHPGYDYHPGVWDGPNFFGYPGPAQHHIRYSRDCRNFNFGPAAGAQESGMVRLESVEYVQECHYVPDPPPPPKPGQPGQPGHPPKPPHAKATEKGMQCHERPADIFRRSVQLSLGARQLQPWETDSFEVCMEGPRVQLRQLDTAYSYDVRELGHYDLRYELTPLYKTPMDPDRNGLSVSAFSHADGKFTFKLSDRWAAEYAGEKVTVKVELYKDGFLFFNTPKGDKEFTFDAANGYEMTFAESELNKPEQPDPAPNYRGPKKYYLRWGFRRVGNISTSKFVKKDQTDKIEVK